jgi:hypothetical protein
MRIPAGRFRREDRCTRASGEQHADRRNSKPMMHFNLFSFERDVPRERAFITLPVLCMQARPENRH